MKNEQAVTASGDAAFEKMVDAALERSPEPAISSDFAARVAAKARMLPKLSSQGQTSYGRSIAFAGMSVLTIALFLLAPHASPDVGDLGFQIEMLVLLQLGGILYWLMKSKQLSL